VENNQVNLPMNLLQIVQFAVTVVQELLKTQDPDEVLQAVEDMRTKFQQVDNDIDKIVGNVKPEREPVNEK
jgi:5-enolpyruvylshikimate-3-phosphate synthase